MDKDTYMLFKDSGRMKFFTCREDVYAVFSNKRDIRTTWPIISMGDFTLGDIPKKITQITPIADCSRIEGLYEGDYFYIEILPGDKHPTLGSQIRTVSKPIEVIKTLLILVYTGDELLVAYYGFNHENKLVWRTCLYGQDGNKGKSISDLFTAIIHKALYQKPLIPRDSHIADRMNTNLRASIRWVVARLRSLYRKVVSPKKTDIRVAKHFRRATVRHLRDGRIVPVKESYPGNAAFGIVHKESYKCN
jgi:hypothetical protein